MKAYVLAVLAVLWSAQVSYAETDPLAKPVSPEARVHLERGNRLYSVREFSRAIEEYKAGALIEAAPVFQYNIAQACRLSGQYKEAIWFYERFEAQGHPQGQLKEAVAGFKAQMKAELAKADVATAPPEVDHSLAPNRYSSRRASNLLHRAPWYRDRVGWGLVSLGAVSGAAASYMFATARSLDRDALHEVRERERSLLHDSASIRRIGGAVFLGAALVGVGVGAIRLALTPAPEGVPVMVSVAWVGE